MTARQSNPLNRPSSAYGYIRVSSPRQHESGLGEEAQEANIKRFYAYKLEPQGIRFGGIFGDPIAVTAKIPILRRKAGAALDRALMRGDWVLMPRLDRGWRNTRDCLNTLDNWYKRGINVYFIANGLTYSEQDPMGVAFIQVVAVFAQMERGLMSQRQKDAWAARKARPGYKPRKMHPAWGEKKKGRKFVADNRELCIMATIRYYAEVEGLGHSAIARKFLAVKMRNCGWSDFGVYNLHQRAVELKLAPRLYPEVFMKNLRCHWPGGLLPERLES